MQFTTTQLEGLIIIEPEVFHDSRGYFFESYNKKEFEKQGIDCNFVQDNQSMSHRNVLRGLHFQIAPHAQGKLVRVIQGAVRDVVVDIRKDSPTFGKNFICELSAKNKRMMWIPAGFAHGFVSLVDNTLFAYKCTAAYHKSSERGIRYNDVLLAIEWGVENPAVSEKDLQLPLFSETLTTI